MPTDPIEDKWIIDNVRALIEKAAQISNHIGQTWGSSVALPRLEIVLNAVLTVFTISMCADLQKQVGDKQGDMKREVFASFKSLLVTSLRPVSALLEGKGRLRSISRSLTDGTLYGLFASDFFSEAAVDLLIQSRMPAEAALTRNIRSVRLSVRRTHLLEDTLELLEKKPKLFRMADRKLRFNLEFSGEPGLGPGVVKDWLQNATRAVFHSDQGAFIQHAESGYWVIDTREQDPAQRMQRIKLLRLTGVLLAMFSIYGMKFPYRLSTSIMSTIFRSPFKRALSAESRIELMKHEEPILTKQFRDLLTVDKDMFDNYCLEFSYTNQQNQVQLLTNPTTSELGGNVEHEQRLHFITAYMSHRIAEIATKEVMFVRDGFQMVLEESFQTSLQIFTVPELERFFFGDETFSFDNIQVLASCTKYGGTLVPANIEWFWKAFSSLTADQRCTLYEFVTCAKVINPANSWALVFDSSISSRSFPKARTCFNHLVLPLYESGEDCMDRINMLVKAIESGEFAEFTIV
jgi:hypothetical protein